MGVESLWCSEASELDHYWAGFRIIDISMATSELIESLRDTAQEPEGEVPTLQEEQPEVMHQLLDKLADSVANYLNAQVAAGELLPAEKRLPLKKHL